MKTDFIRPSASIRFPPSPHTKFDVLILGAGCAGLSLALRLAKDPNYRGRVLLVDRRVEYRADRTWCFFHPLDSDLLPDAVIERQWQWGRISNKDHQVRLDFAHQPYTELSALSFYGSALERLSQDARFSLAFGHAIDDSAISARSDNTQVRIDGEVYETRWLIDSRHDGSLSQRDAALWQVFMGFELETETARFETSEAVLMDFLEEDAFPVSFLYVLPRSPHCALMEYTVFSRSFIQPDQLEAALRGLVKDRLEGLPYKILRTEAGVIPMGMQTGPSASPGWIEAGLLNGAARPSTGYAFLRIQRWSRECAKAITQGACTPTVIRDPMMTSMMDGLFLKVLGNRHSRGSDILTQLFKRTPTPSLVRFLNDEGNFIDHLKVIWAMPKIPFFRQLFALLHP